MGQAAPDVKQISVKFDGQWYTVHWTVHAGCVMLLHPHLCRIGVPLHLGNAPERIAEMLVIRGLDHLRARGHLWMVSAGAPFAFAMSANHAQAEPAERTRRRERRRVDDEATAERARQS